MTDAFLTTSPRETEVRWLRPRTDEIAVYHQPGPIVPVRTVEIAALGAPLIVWLPVLSGPRLLPTGGRTRGTVKFEITVARSVTDTAAVAWADREQVVYRERVPLDAWDVEPVPVCRGLDGACYLPSGHPGLCDPDAAAPEHPRTGDGVRSADDIAALVDVISFAA